MVDLDTGGVDAFLAALDVEQVRFNAEVSRQYRAWIKAIFYDITELTPQWSGNLAANWFASPGGDHGFEQTLPDKDLYWPLPHYLEPHVRGDAEAVGISRARFDEQIFGYLDAVWIFNPAEIAPAVEAQSIHIRGVNLLDGRVAMIAYAAQKYANFMPVP